MTEPFRDELTAALDRAGRLAEENAELRARLDAAARPPAPEPIAPALEPPVPPPPDSTARHTLDRLDGAGHGGDGGSPGPWHRPIDTTSADPSVLGPPDVRAKALFPPRPGAAHPLVGASNARGVIVRVTPGAAVGVVFLGVLVFLFGVLVGLVAGH